ncbi:coiled-coil domain-containing protein 40 [Lampris incognitus]|uniref:coiled-coil domain-containing protein 40 n=1 Tax=Lampris incognitus TaxID=2546036 RepID=UPI0024B52384|nr:coiled-coil domain-containing protein 40 [Lampris incognitus]
MPGELAEDENMYDTNRDYEINVHNTILDTVIESNGQRFEKNGKLYADSALLDPHNFPEIREKGRPASGLDELSKKLRKYDNRATTEALQTELQNLATHWDKLKLSVLGVCGHVVCEQSFSTLKFIKNRLRSTASQELLEAFMLMATDKDVLMSLDMDCIIDRAQMEMDSLAMERKQLLQQWNSSLVGMKKRDEAFTAMQEALRLAQHQVLSLDREIESYEQSITKEEEQNEILTMQLNRSQVDVSSSKRLISQIQSQQEALQPQYTTYLSTLQEMERTLARLNTEKSLCQAELSNLSRQLEKESASSLELEDRIMAQMQQEFTHDKAAKYSQRLINKMASLKKEKIGQLQQLENELAMVRLESSEVSQCLDDLVPALEALEKDITERNKLLTTCQAKIASQVIIIERNQATITTYNKKIKQIQESTGHMDLSPLQIHAESMAKELEELEVDIKKKQLLWMRQQGVLVGLTKEKQTNSEEMHKLQAQYTIFQQRNICTEREMEVERREQADVERHMKMLRGDMLKLNSLLSHNDKLKQTLQQENTLVETDFLHRLKEAEREAIEVQMRLEKTREEKKRLLNSLVEAERQVMLWEKKTQLLRKTFSAVNSEVFQGDIRQMKAEIHRMELHHSQLMKQQERLQRESEATVSRMENISLRREARSSKKQTTQSHLNHIIQGLRHNIKDTHKQVAECEEVIKGLQESQVSVSSRLALKKQELTEQHNTTSVLTSDLLKLQDSKDMNLARLLALQNRAKHLQTLREGRYTPLSNREAVGAALQRQTERMHAVSAIVHQVYEEFPQHQGALYRLTLALAARMQALD